MPLQPIEAEQRMDPHVVAVGGDEMVILWRQRGVSLAGDRFDGPVLGLYQLREGKLARAQMFYFDTVGLVDSLHEGARPYSGRRHRVTVAVRPRRRSRSCTAFAQPGNQTLGTT
jgi:hypothetical protein